MINKRQVVWALLHLPRPVRLRSSTCERACDRSMDCHGAQATLPILDSIFPESMAPGTVTLYPQLARSRIGLALPGGFRSSGDSGHGVPSPELALLTQCGHQSALCNRISS